MKEKNENKDEYGNNKKMKAKETSNTQVYLIIYYALIKPWSLYL